MTEKFKQRGKEWHAARETRLTSSNFAAAIGINKYKSRPKLWREYKKLEPKFEGNEATQWGVENESTAIQSYEKETGNKVGETGFHLHKKYDWLGGSPDGLIDLDGGIEVKCPYYAKTPHESVPDLYMPQVQGCLEITDRAWWDYVSWTPSGTTYFRVYRSKEYWDWALPLLEEFWSFVERNERPNNLRRRPIFRGSLKIVKFDGSSLTFA